MRARVWSLLVLTVVGAAVVGCKNGRLRSSACKKDADCGANAAGFRCEASTGVCYCRNDLGCAPSEACNEVGFCQSRVGCDRNGDCTNPAEFCDTTTGACLAKGRCSIDLHCGLGQVCDAAKSVCVEGCRSQGDCDAVSCRCGTTACACSGVTAQERAQCPIGVCDAQFCADASYCQYGEVCGVLPDAGTNVAQCYSDFDSDERPYCANCTYGGGVNICGTGANYCLIDTAHVGNSFCGADCSSGQTCPRGYACQDVVVVSSQWVCTRSNPSCPGNPSSPCVSDAECPRGATCRKETGAPTGFCAGVCRVDENSNTGFCSCVLDDDCAQEVCLGGECSISRRGCVNDADCRRIHCVDFKNAGGCFIGQNCAPAEGLTCLEVQPE